MSLRVGKAPRMKKVDFFIVGGAKCGTTWVHNMLVQRHDVSLPEQKETNFFAFLGKDVNFSGPLDKENTNKFTVRDLSAYHELFSNERAAWIEACPSYLYVKEAAENIYQYNREAKVLLILRDPVERAWSNHQHLVRDGAEQESFERALELENARHEAGWVWFWDIFKQGLYFDQVVRYLTVFPAGAVKVMFFEDIQRDALAFMRAVELFFGLQEFGYQFSVDKNESGVPSGGFVGVHRLLYQPSRFNALLRKLLPEQTRKNISSLFKRSIMQKQVICPETRSQLVKRYIPEIEKLEQLLERDLSLWKRP